MYPALEEGNKDADYWAAYKTTGMAFLDQTAKSLGSECEESLLVGVNSDSWWLQRHCQVCFWNPSREDSTTNNDKKQKLRCTARLREKRKTEKTKN